MKLTYLMVSLLCAYVLALFFIHHNPFTMFKYTLKVSHDQGYIKLSTVASSDQAAVNVVQLAEGCPVCAIEIVSKVAL